MAWKISWVQHVPSPVPKMTRDFALTFAGCCLMIVVLNQEPERDIPLPVVGLLELQEPQPQRLARLEVRRPWAAQSPSLSDATAPPKRSKALGTTLLAAGFAAVLTVLLQLARLIRGQHRAMRWASLRD